MANKKIKVMVVCSDRTGVSKFRSVEPHMKLQELYNDDFFVEIITAGDTINWDDEKYVKSFDIIHFHRSLSINGQQVFMEPMWKLLDKIKGYGVVTVMDLDDYWEAGPEHPMHKLLKQQQLGLKIKNNLKRVDYVTTTTPIYANEIKKLNKNVVVLPNAINPDEPQFTPNPEKSDRLRVGWLGGSSHEQDLAVAYGGVGQFIDDNKDNTQFVLCGFDTRGNITEINQQTGEQKNRKIKPQESVWYRYESNFTKNYSYITPDLKTNLMKFDRESDEHTDFSNQAYRRVWTKPITTYASNYNLFDVSLAPLKETMFNKVKSQLKVIEAGFHKKALIAQDFGPYQLDIVNMIEKGGKINENGNGILIPSKRNHKQWQKEIKRLYENRELVDLLGDNLYNTVVNKYHIDVVTKTRAEMYKRIVSDNQNEIKEIIEETNAV